jgi:hypothetical protein
LVLATLELPWRDNQRNVSAIPPGQYSMQATTGRVLPSGDVIPWTYEVLNVPGRSGILFHHGNYPKNSSGCILIGFSFAGPTDYDTIRNSRAALEQFGKLAQAYKKAELCITERFIEADHEN